MVANSIDECKAGGRAELILYIVKVYAPKPVRVCSKCWSKKCKDWCGKEDYVNKMNYFFIAGDRKNGLINVRIPPWFDGDGSIVKEEYPYKISGKIGEYEGKLDLIAEKIEVKKVAIA